MASSIGNSNMINAMRQCQQNFQDGSLADLEFEDYDEVFPKLSSIMNHTTISKNRILNKLSAGLFFINYRLDFTSSPKVLWINKQPIFNIPQNYLDQSEPGYNLYVIASEYKQINKLS